MSYHSSNGSYPSTWPQQRTGQCGVAPVQAGNDFSNQNRETHSQPGNDISYWQYHNIDGRGPMYSGYDSQSISRAPHVQSTAAPAGGYPVSSSIRGYAGGYQPSAYNSTLPQYGNRAGEWPNAQQDPIAPGNHNATQPHVAASSMSYASPLMPYVAPRADVGADSGYSSSNAWQNSVGSIPQSSAVQHTNAGRSTGSGAEYTVPCPYGCGTVLTGIHAVGNMTRHLKSQNCVASGKEKTRYACPVKSCDKQYIRSDGLKVHLRKRHNISQVPDKSGSLGFDESAYEYT